VQDVLTCILGLLNSLNDYFQQCVVAAQCDFTKERGFAMATIDQVIKELQEMKSQKGNTGETRIISFVFGKEDFRLSQEDWDEYMESYSFVGPGVDPHLHIDIESKIGKHVKEHVDMASKYKEKTKEESKYKRKIK